MIERGKETFTNRLQQLQLRRQILEKLGTLNFHAYVRAIELFLRTSGLRDVTVAGRKTVHAPTDCGGLDLVARVRSGIHAATVLIQVKQVRSPVQRRFVDELRGTMLRLGASHGLIITNGTFSDRAVSAASLYPGRPVRLIAGPELARLMVELGVGVRPDPLVRHFPRLVLDMQFFEELTRRYR